MNRRFYAPEDEGIPGYYMEIEQWGDEWYITFHDAKGNCYCSAGGYESEAYAMRKAHDFRPKWRDPWMEEPGVCPACGSHDCEAPHVTANGNTMTMWAECCECGAVYMEDYELTTKRMGWSDE